MGSVGSGCWSPAERICRAALGRLASRCDEVRVGEGAEEGPLLPGLLRDPGLPGSAGGSPGGNTRTIL